MVHAHSSPLGILFSDTAFDAPNTVYARRTDGKIDLVVGEYKELEARFTKEQKALKSAEHRKSIDRAAGAFIVGVVALPVLVGLLGGRAAWVVAAALFMLVATVPLIALLMTFTDPYDDTETFSQFKRHHGAEHAVLAYSRTKKGGWTLEELRACSIVDPECGTVYMASALIWAAVLGLSVANIATLGLLKTVGVVLLGAVVLLLNIWFNPHNPLQAFQHRMVETPGDDELLLAVAGHQELTRITKGRQ